MRIISGKLKGTSLYKSKDKSTRPLKDMVRESIFNLLTHSNKISFEFKNSKVLDIYAGTGSFGLECISRQAKSVFCIEKDKSAVEVLKKNIQKLKVKDKTKIFLSDVYDIIENKNFLENKFDLIFCDPPFKSSDIDILIKSIFDKKILRENGIIILHRNKNTLEKLPNCLQIIETRKYGLSKIFFGKFLL